MKKRQNPSRMPYDANDVLWVGNRLRNHPLTYHHEHCQHSNYQSVSVCLSLRLSDSLSLCPSVSLSVSFSLSLSVSLPLSPSFSLCVSISLCLSVCLSVSLRNICTVCIYKKQVWWWSCQHIKGTDALKFSHTWASILIRLNVICTII